MIEARRRGLRPVCTLIFSLVATVCAAQQQVEANRSFAPEPVMGVTWEWTGTATTAGQISVLAPERYTIRLKPDGEAQIRYDCNHGGSLYELSEGRLSLGRLTYTRIPCRSGSKSIIYRKQLDAVRSFFTEDGHLFLELSNDQGTMRFRERNGT